MAVRMFAAIEVGSFELEMGIYEISGKNRIRQVDHVRHVISLGSDTYNDRKISYEMVEELCRVLEDFVQDHEGLPDRLNTGPMPPAPCGRRRTAGSFWSRSGSAPGLTGQDHQQLRTETSDL